MSNAVIGALRANLGLDTAQFDRGVRQAESGMTRLARGFRNVATVVAGATAAFSAAVIAALNFAESISDTADRAGISAERLQELRFAFTQNGVSTQEADQALVRFNSSLAEFATTGKGVAAEGFKRIGIESAGAARALGTTEEALDEVLRRLSRMPVEAEQTRAAVELFGRQAGPALAILLRQGEGAIDAATAKARELGLVMGEDTVRNAAKASAELRAMRQVLQTQLTVALASAAPMVLQLAQAFADAVPRILQATQAVLQFIGVIGPTIDQQIVDRVQELRRVQDRIADIAQGGARQVRRGERDRLEAEQAQLQGELRALEEQRTALSRSLQNALTVPEVPTVGGGGGGRAGRDAFGQVSERFRTMTRDANHAAEAVGLVGTELVAVRERLRAYAMIMDESENLTVAQSQALSEMAEQYIAAAISAEELREAQEQANRASAEAKAFTDRMISGFSQAAQQADSFRDALRRLSIQLLEVAARGLFLGEGPLAGLGAAFGAAIGSNATGTANWRGGLTMVGERGPELVALPGGSRVFDAAATSRMNAAPVINIDARGATDPSVVEMAARRGAQAALQAASAPARFGASSSDARARGFAG